MKDRVERLLLFLRVCLLLLNWFDMRAAAFFDTRDQPTAGCQMHRLPPHHLPG